MLWHTPATRLQCKRDAEPHCLGRADGTVPIQPRLPIPAKYFGRYMARAIRDGVLITLDDPKTALRRTGESSRPVPFVLRTRLRGWAAGKNSFEIVVQINRRELDRVARYRANIEPAKSAIIL